VASQFRIGEDALLRRRSDPSPSGRTSSLVYFRLCKPPIQDRLLHGDLHHDNVLFDSRRGGLAIDPKGVIGELKYEIGAALETPTIVRTYFRAATE